MAFHWQKQAPKSAATYKLQHQAKALMAEKGHTIGRFKRMSHGLFVAFCVKCGESVAVDNYIGIVRPENIKTAEHE